MESKTVELFEKDSVAVSVLKLAAPSIAGQIILVIYNMADTYFVGLLNSESMISSVTVSMPAFMLLSAISNLFGIGGGAAFSRALGCRDSKREGLICSSALIGCAAATAFFAAAVFAFKPDILNFLGARDPAVRAMSSVYLDMTVVFGGLFTALGGFFAHLLRAEGRSGAASTGVMLGGILNILLDPLFIFVLFGKERAVTAVAAATAVSNFIAFAFFIVLLKIRPTLLSFRLEGRLFGNGVFKEILTTGLPAFLMTLCENVSYAVLDNLMSANGVSAQAAVGVAKKINMLAHSTVRGLAQGVLPLIAYSYASGNVKRLRGTVRLTLIMAASVSGALMVIYMVFAPQLSDVFLEEGSVSIGLAAVFLRILCTGCPFSAFAYTVISFFHATGFGGRSFLLAVLRKGALDIPMMFIIGRALPVYGIVLATPFADICCAAVSAVLLARWFKKSINPVYPDSLCYNKK